MKIMVTQWFDFIVKVSLFLFLAAFGGSASLGQDSRSVQVADPGYGNMGPYRALAGLCYQEFRKGDDASAARFARILERTWDKGEEIGGEDSVAKRMPAAFVQIDKAMDAFIKPLMEYKASAPDPAKVEAAYTAFLEKLKSADSFPHQQSGVQYTRLGLYRSLLELLNDAWKRGDAITARKLATTLSWTFSKYEKKVCNESLSKSNPALLDQIETAHQAYFAAMWAAEPDPVAVQAAYKKYLELLSLGDSEAMTCPY
jgi:hypothetical protein